MLIRYNYINKYKHMKKILVLLFAIGMMATTQFTATAQTAAETISFINEIGCELNYKIVDLADIIASSDTPDDDDEAIRLIYEFEESFPSELGPDEPAIAVLVPDDNYFNGIFLQETEEGEILTLRILPEDGWIECVSKDEDLLFLAGMIAFIQHLDEVYR